MCVTWFLVIYKSLYEIAKNQREFNTAEHSPDQFFISQTSLKTLPPKVIALIHDSSNPSNEARLIRASGFVSVLCIRHVWHDKRSPGDTPRSYSRPSLHSPLLCQIIIKTGISPHGQSFGCCRKSRTRKIWDSFSTAHRSR